MNFWKLVNNLHFTKRRRDSLDCSSFENCYSRKGVQQYLRNQLDALKTKWFWNDRIMAVSMILARHLFTLVTWLNFTRSWEDSHFGSESWWCAVLTATTWTCQRTVGFNSRQCPFRTNVNRTFCPAQPKLMGHLEKLIGLCPMSKALRHHWALFLLSLSSSLWSCDSWFIQVL